VLSQINPKSIESRDIPAEKSGKEECCAERGKFVLI
jgi:hypothetical protein